MGMADVYPCLLQEFALGIKHLDFRCLLFKYILATWIASQPLQWCHRDQMGEFCPLAPSSCPCPADRSALYHSRLELRCLPIRRPKWRCPCMEHWWCLIYDWAKGLLKLNFKDCVGSVTRAHRVIHQIWLMNLSLQIIPVLHVSVSTL